MILASQDQMDLNRHKMANVCGVLLVYALFCSMDTNCATENTFRPTIDTVYSPYFRSQSMFQANPVKVESPSGDPVLAFFLDRSNRLQSKIEVNMDTEFTATFDVIVVCANPDVALVAEVTVDGLESISIVGENRFMFSCSNLTGIDLFDPAIILQRQNSSNYVRQREVFVAERQIHVKLISGVIGFGTLHFRLYNLTSGTENYNSRNDTTLHTDQNNKTLVLSEENTYESLTYTVTVVRKIRLVDKLFRICIFCVQIFVATGFGAKLHLDVVKENVLKPIAPCIGLASQYLIMPLIAFAIAKAVPIDTTVISLGIFVAGCCPGGGGSNMYSYLLKGDLDLSITMTALSTVLALAMMPLWVYTLGSVFLTGSDLQIPFETVAVSLSLLIVPLLVGILLRQKFPSAADKLSKALKPVIFIMSLILLVVGVYSNLYVFRVIRPNILLAALLLPYIGYLCGGLFALIFRQPWTRIKTIAIETGMQNTNIAYILLTSSFPAPLGDIAAVAPVSSAVMTPLPPFVITVFYLIYQRFRRKRDGKKDLKGENNANDVEAHEKLTAEVCEKAEVCDEAETCEHSAQNKSVIDNTSPV